MMASAHFLAGVVVGFIGYLPLGMINLTVADTAVRKGMREGLSVAFGAALIGVLQAWISVECSHIIMDDPRIERIITWVSVPVLIGAGIYFLTAHTESRTRGVQRKGPGGVIRGVIISIMNVIAIPYWLFYSAYLAGAGVLDLSKGLFVGLVALGGGFGMFLAFYIYALMAVRARKRGPAFRKYSNRALSAIMFLLGVIQVVRIVT